MHSLIFNCYEGLQSHTMSNAGQLAVACQSVYDTKPKHEVGEKYNEQQKKNETKQLAAKHYEPHLQACFSPDCRSGSSPGRRKYL